MQFKNRVTEMLGVEIPIVQAPMGWIARAQLASAVSNAGGLGIIETSSGELDAIREEIKKMRTLTDKPFGVNIAQAFVRDPAIVSFVIDQGVKFVTTSAGSPERYTSQLKEAGLTVFHVVPSLAAALKAVECEVDGLIVEDVATMVLLPLVRSKVKVPLIAAGGFVDGSNRTASMRPATCPVNGIAASMSPLKYNERAVPNSAIAFTSGFFSSRVVRSVRNARKEVDPEVWTMT